MNKLHSEENIFMSSVILNMLAFPWLLLPFVLGPALLDTFWKFSPSSDLSCL